MNSSALSVLFIGNGESAVRVHQALETSGLAVRRVVEERHLMGAIARGDAGTFDVAVYRLGSGTADTKSMIGDWLEAYQVPMVVLADAWEEGLATDAVHAGADDFLLIEELHGRALGRAIRCALARGGRLGGVRPRSFVEDGGRARREGVPRPRGTKGSARVLLVDDHPAIRRGLIEYLKVRTEYQVVGEASTGEEAIELARELRPDVIAMDLIMPGMGGLEAIRRIAQEDPRVRIIALTADPEEDALMPALEAGASGFVDKTTAHLDLPEALRSVLDGEIFVYPSGQRLLLSAYRESRRDDGCDLVWRLSEQDREILRFIAEGFTSKEIGKALFLAPSTVDTYRSQLMKSLGLGHRTEVVRLAVRSGLLSTRTVGYQMS